MIFRPSPLTTKSGGIRKRKTCNFPKEIPSLDDLQRLTPSQGALLYRLVELGYLTPTQVTLRSYHISSEKIKRELGFVPKRTLEDAVRDLVAAFRAGKIPDPMTDSRYYNIKTMQHLQLK